MDYFALRATESKIERRCRHLERCPGKWRNPCEPFHRALRLKKKFRARILWRPMDLSSAPVSWRARKERHRRYRAWPASHAEASVNFHAIVAGDQNISGFDVAMNDSH